MEFTQAFAVAAPPDKVYSAMMDIPRVASCVPGASVAESDGVLHRVLIKVRVGPVSMQYRGDVRVVEQDETARRAVLAVEARETRGQGTAQARVSLQLSPAAAGTHGEIVTDVKLSGKAAAMGGGAIRDVSARLISQFAANLSTMLAAPPAVEQADDSSGTGDPGGIDEPGPASDEGAVTPGRRSVIQASTAASTPPLALGADPAGRAEEFDAGSLAREMALEQLTAGRILITGAVALGVAVALVHRHRMNGLRS